MLGSYFLVCFAFLIPCFAAPRTLAQDSTFNDGDQAQNSRVLVLSLYRDFIFVFASVSIVARLSRCEAHSGPSLLPSIISQAITWPDLPKPRSKSTVE